MARLRLSGHPTRWSRSQSPHPRYQERAQVDKRLHVIADNNAAVTGVVTTPDTKEETKLPHTGGRTVNSPKKFGAHISFSGKLLQLLAITNSNVSHLPPPELTFVRRRCVQSFDPNIGTAYSAHPAEWQLLCGLKILLAAFPKLIG